MLAILDRNLERWALLVFYSMLVATMSIEVLRRELLSYSSIWGEEIVRYAFIYLAWIGAASAVRERAHIRIDVIYGFLGRRSRTVLYIFGDLVMLGVAVLAVWWSLDTVAVSWKFGSVTDGLRISKVWFLLAVPVGFALMIFRLGQSLMHDFSALRHGRAPYEGERLFD